MDLHKFAALCKYCTLYLRAISKYKPPPPPGGGGLMFGGGFFTLRVWVAYMSRGLYMDGAYFRNFTVCCN